MTRSRGYNLEVLQGGECGLVVNHVHTEDPLFLKTSSSYMSNPLHVANVVGRDGSAQGTEDFILLQAGGGSTALLENIESTGHISVMGANQLRLVTRNLTFTPKAPPGRSDCTRILGPPPYGGEYDLGAGPRRTGAHLVTPQGAVVAPGSTGPAE